MFTFEDSLTLALAGVHRAFPYHFSAVLREPLSLQSPRDLTPVFFGCFDWHSAVHGHWLLALGRRICAGHALADTCEAALERSFTAAALATEADFLRAHPAFERPYGLVWILALSAELANHGDATGRRWRSWVQPLEQAAADNLATWLPKLSHPIRSGTHAQTAFALSLALDWARRIDHVDMERLLRDRALSFYKDDRDYPLHLEPSGEDFLSPSLSAASLMSRLLDDSELATWLDHALPELGRRVHLEPVDCRDRRDGRLTHLDGLNLSRAWMLADLEAALPRNDARRAALADARLTHRTAGLAAISTDEYAGSHWLGTFAAWMMLREDRLTGHNRLVRPSSRF